MQLRWLKFIYNGLLTGMPPMTYNAISKTTFHVPFTIQPYSTYINYALTSEQQKTIQNYIHEYDSDIEMVPVKLFALEETAKYYLSVNVYNCSSPIFFTDKDKSITRLEINTYIKKKDKKGTLLLDYTSNALSMDPVHGFKLPESLDFYFPSFKTNQASIHTTSEKDNVNLKMNYLPFNYQPPHKQAKLHENLIKYSDRIYYKNGIFDKLYYDSSLAMAHVVISMYHDQDIFQYRNLTFKHPISIFYFENPIYFTGGMWDNLFSPDS